MNSDTLQKESLIVRTIVVLAMIALAAVCASCLTPGTSPR